MISVCVATFDGEKYINEQLDSILANIGPTDEVIVSDDGSCDGTADILSGYAESDRRIRVLNGPQRGVIANFANAIARANGAFIFLSDQDDVWRADKVAKVLNAFESKQCDLVVHNARLIDANGRRTGDTLFDLRESRSGFFKNVVKNSYVGCCMAFSRDLLPAIMPIPENVEMHDWWIGLVAELRFRPVFINDELIEYRRHSDNVSPMHHYGIGKMVANRFTLLKELRKRVVSLEAVQE